MPSVLPYANFWKGEIAYRNNEYDEAISTLSFYLQSNAPAQGEANQHAAKYDLGYSWLKKENYKQAWIILNRLQNQYTVTSSAMEQDAYVRSADCYFMEKDFAKANTMYDNVINNALPQSDYAMFQKAMIAGVKSSTDKIKTLNTLYTTISKSNLVPDVNMEIANTYMADEKFMMPFLI